MSEAVDMARIKGILGTNVLGSCKSFDMEVRVGAGAYICGEETSLLNSLEGKRGVVRAKPPLPALEGFMGKPTVVNNVISLATVPVIFEKGAEHHASFGVGRSRGTVTLQIAGNVNMADCSKPLLASRSANHFGNWGRNSKRQARESGANWRPSWLLLANRQI